MWMELEFSLLLIVILVTSEVRGQCTFQSEFRSTTWHDNTKGTLTFTDTTMTGWNFMIYGQNVDSWECLDNTSSNYLILKSSSFVTVSNINYYSYLCLKLTSITAHSYYYYQMFLEQPNAGHERVKIDVLSTLTGNDVCDATFQGQDAEFHVLVKTGFEANAAVTCPESLLFSGDYMYLNSDGSFDCNGTTDVMDVCTDSTAITYDYTKCTQRIGYSENGSFYCVASLTFGGYDYVVLYNRDSTVTVSERNSNNALNHDTDTSRFSCLFRKILTRYRRIGYNINVMRQSACLVFNPIMVDNYAAFFHCTPCTDGSTASVSPHNCTTFQTPSAYPSLADMTTVNGYLLVFNGTKYATTTTTMAPTEEEDTGLSSGVVAAIVVVILLLLVAVVVIIAIYCYLRSRKKVSELEKPIMARNGVQPHIETIDETAKGNKLLRERSNLSREGTTLSRQGTLTSLKKQGSNLSGKKAAQKEDNKGTESGEKPLLGLPFLAFCPCKSRSGETEPDNTCIVRIGGICTRMKDCGGTLLAVFPCSKTEDVDTADKDVTGTSDGKTKGKTVSPKKGPSVKGSKLATKDKKGGKAKAEQAKGGKDKKDKVASNQTQTEKSTLKTKEKLTKSDIILVNTPRAGSPSKEAETITVEATETSKGETKTSKTTTGDKSTKKKKGKQGNKKGKGKSDDEATDTEKEKSVDQEKSKLAREKTDVSGVSSVRRPGTVVTLSEIDSEMHAEETNLPKPAKPTQKKKFLDWNFLVCLQGNRSPELVEEDKKELHVVPVKTKPKKPEKAKAVKGKKGTKKGGPKGDKKSNAKVDKNTSKKDADEKLTAKDKENDKENDSYAKMPVSGRSMQKVEGNEMSGVERSKTLPLRREETTVTLQDGKIAVDVYVPDEKTNLQLKDTVRNLEDKKGKDTIKGITKAKTTLGTTRPASSKEKSEQVKTVENVKKHADKKTGSKAGKSKTTVGAKKKKKKT